MSFSLEEDLKRLRHLACRGKSPNLDIVRMFHRLGSRIRRRPEHSIVEKLYAWLFVPAVLWPLELPDFLRQVLRWVGAGKRLRKEVVQIVAMLGDPPSGATSPVLRKHMHATNKGCYESLIRSRHKYSFTEQTIMKDSRFRSEWRMIKRLFQVGKYQNANGVIHRQMVGERNSYDNYPADWRCREDLFWALFDTFCFRWNLYGMKRDRPLLLKMSVDVTPYGTMIFVPAYWSLDPKRDLKWGAISALHRARGVRRQGEKLGKNRLERHKEAAVARYFWREATAAGMRGEERMERVMSFLGWASGTDRSKLLRLLKEE
jgi:hypothetical protein